MAKNPDGYSGAGAKAFSKTMKRIKLENDLADSKKVTVKMPTSGMPKVDKLADKMGMIKNRIMSKVADMKNTNDTFRDGAAIYRTNPDGSAKKVFGIGKKKLPTVRR